MKHGVVVAAVALGRNADLLATARASAKAAHAGYAYLNVANEQVAEDVALLDPDASDLVLLVVRRPGTVSYALPGYSDIDTVAQAVMAKPVTTTGATTTDAVAPAAAAPTTTTPTP